MIKNHLKGNNLYTKRIHSENILEIESDTKICLNTSNLYINGIPFYQIVRHVYFDEPITFSSIFDMPKSESLKTKTLIFSNIIHDDTTNVLTLSSDKGIVFKSKDVFLRNMNLSKYIEDIKIIKRKEEEKVLLKELSDWMLIDFDDLERQKKVIMKLKTDMINYEKQYNTSFNTYEDEIINEIMSDMTQTIFLSICSEIENNIYNRQEIKNEISRLEVELQNESSTEVQMKNTLSTSCHFEKLGSYKTNCVLTDKICFIDTCSNNDDHGLDIINENGINLFLTSFNKVSDIVKNIHFGDMALL